MIYARYLMGALLAVLVALPLLTTSNYVLYMVSSIGMWTIMGSGTNLITGYNGQVSIGQAAVMGLGAYSSALLVTKVGLPFWVAFLAAGVISGLTGVVLAYPAFRTKGIYFSFVTIGLNEIFVEVASNWEGLTGGSFGIRAIPPLPTLGMPGRMGHYYLILGLALLTLLLVRILVRSHFGEAMIAIKENETLAQGLGLKPFRYKSVTFMIGCFFTALAGSLYGHYMSFISPEIFNVMFSFQVLAAVIIGGGGTVLGPVAGSSLMLLLPEVLRSAREVSMVVFAILLLLVIRYVPEGIVGRIERVLVARQLRAQSASEKPMAKEAMN